MKRLILGLASVVASPFVASANSITDVAYLDGAWKFNYPCAGATGVYADRCAADERDDFNISIAHKNGKVCGAYETTAQIGNHVDDGWIDDWKFEKVRSGTYRVHFHLEGTVGVALIHVVGNKMAWKLITQRPSGESGPFSWSFSPPDSAILVREPNANPAECDRS